MNRTIARINKGSSIGHFLITVPNERGIDERNTGTVVGKVDSIWCTPITEDVVSLAGMTFTYRLTGRFSLYKFKIDSPPVTPLLLREKLDSRYIIATTTDFPQLTSLPLLFYDEDQGLYQLNLPPRSGFFTTQEPLVFALGFRNYETYTRNVPTVKRENVVEKTVYGFENPTLGYLTVIATEQCAPEEPLENQLYGSGKTSLTSTSMFVLEKLDTVNVDPIAVEMTENDGQESIDIETEVAATVEAVVPALAKIFRKIALLCDNTNSIVDVHPSLDPNYPNSIVINNRAMKGHKGTLSITFGPDLATLFRPMTGLVFNMEQPLSFSLPLKSVSISPFENRTPITIRGSLGTAKSWIEPIGFAPFVTIIKGLDKPYLAEPLTITGSDRTISLQFFDKAMAPIVFQRDFHVHLVMKFKRVTPDEDSGRAAQNLKKLLATFEEQRDHQISQPRFNT